MKSTRNDNGLEPCSWCRRVKRTADFVEVRGIPACPECVERIATDPDYKPVSLIPDDPLTLDLLAGVLAKMYQHHLTQLRDREPDDEAEVEPQQLTTEQPLIKSELTVQEFAAEICASPETVRYMIRDGLIGAHERAGSGKGGQWYIPADEVKRFKR